MSAPLPKLELRNIVHACFHCNTSIRIQTNGYEPQSVHALLEEIEKRLKHSLTLDLDGFENEIDSLILSLRAVKENKEGKEE